jgi:ribonucleoside-diphosphate reductase beta chain
MKSIINTNQKKNSLQPIFFGKEGMGIQRYDQPKYEKLFNMFKQQLSYFWRPEEINVSKDKSDFNNLSEHEKFIFTKNLGYQILLDSIQSRGISNLLENCTNSEIEAFAKAWEFSETIHSYSYTYIIKQIYTNPTEVLDNILEDEEIIKRASSVTKYYDALINKIPDESEYDRKKKLYLTLVSINILEGIRFYVSFACSFAFAQNKKMTGNAKIISLIARDENLHMGFSSFVLKRMGEDESEGFLQIAEDCKETVIQMYKDAADEEIEWAKYLFKDGSIIGLNSDILIEYMQWLTNNRLKMIKLDPIFDKVKNPISWIGNWIGGNTVQEAPQEEQIISYTVGAFKQDVDDENYDEFNF